MTDDRPTVLIVEDEPDLAEVYSAHLADGYRVRTALSGADALDMLDGSVDVVLLDRKMPGLSGDDVLEEITRQGYRCRVAMVTAVAPKTEIIDFEVADYLVKPVSGTELRRTVRQLLTMTTHEEAVREFVELSMKQATLETENDPSTLHTDPEYQRLDSRLGELATTLGDLSGELSDTEFEDFLERMVDQMSGSETTGRR